VSPACTHACLLHSCCSYLLGSASALHGTCVCSQSTEPFHHQGHEITSLACGGEHSLAATDSGEVFAWGWGRYGNLGDGPAQDRHLPTKVTNPLHYPAPPPPPTPPHLHEHAEHATPKEAPRSCCSL
jgi:hypothetical protein